MKNILMVINLAILIVALIFMGLGNDDVLILLLFTFIGIDKFISLYFIIFRPKHETPKVSIDKLTKEVCGKCDNLNNCQYVAFADELSCSIIIKQIGR
jgi:hypothetical protein